MVSLFLTGLLLYSQAVAHTKPTVSITLSSSTLLRSYVWGVDESGTQGGAAGVGGLVAFTDHRAGGGTWFTLTDGRGNVSTLVNAATGEADGRLHYGPFGELLLASGSAARLPLRWSTKYEDAETSFVYYGRRYYDPVTGRWLSRDPIGEAGGVNLYGFVGNDPVDGIDPVGEMDRRSRPVDFRNDPGTVSVDLSLFNWNSHSDLGPPQQACGRSPILNPRPAPARWSLESLLGTGNDPQSVATLSPAGVYQYELVPRRSGNPANDPAMLNIAYAFGLPELADSELGRSLIRINTDTIITAPGGELFAARVLARLRAIRCVPKAEPLPLPAQRFYEPGELAPLQSGDLTFLPGELMPNGQLAGIGPGAMYSEEPLQDIIAGVQAAGKYDATVGSLDEARRVIRAAMPDAVEVPAAIAGKPYPNPESGVRKWFQVQPAEPNVGNNFPHIKYQDWTQGKKGNGGSWGHIFFPPSGN